MKHRWIGDADLPGLGQRAIFRTFFDQREKVKRARLAKAKRNSGNHAAKVKKLGKGVGRGSPF